MGAEEVIWGEDTVPCAFGARHAHRRNMSLSCPTCTAVPSILIFFDLRIWRLCRSVWIAPEEHRLGSPESMRHVDSKARIAPPYTFVVVLRLWSLMFAFWHWHLQTYEIVALTLSGATAYVAINSR